MPRPFPKDHVGTVMQSLQAKSSDAWAELQELYAYELQSVTNPR